MCGGGLGSDPLAWRKKLQEDLGDQYELVQAKSSTGQMKELQRTDRSLDRYLGPSEMEMVSRDLRVVSTCDFVVANISSLAFECTSFILYSSVGDIPVVAFAESETAITNDLRYVLPYVRRFFASYSDAIDFLKQGMGGLRNGESRGLLFEAITDQINNILSKEDRKDSLFRAAVFVTQVGQSFHYLTHDKAVNPAARPVGSRADEEAQLGDALVQLLIYLQSRGFYPERAYRAGTRRMKEVVWRHKQTVAPIRELRPGEIAYGISASRGKAIGKVRIVKTQTDTEKIRNGKYIVVIGEYNKQLWDDVITRFDNVLGVISETGSENSHPAIVCREFRKPCIMSVVGITELVKDDQELTMEVDPEENSIRRAEG